MFYLCWRFSFFLKITFSLFIFCLYLYWLIDCLIILVCYNLLWSRCIFNVKLYYFLQEIIRTTNLSYSEVLNDFALFLNLKVYIKCTPKRSAPMIPKRQHHHWDVNINSWASWWSFSKEIWNKICQIINKFYSITCQNIHNLKLYLPCP